VDFGLRGRFREEFLDHHEVWTVLFQLSVGLHFIGC
jgi:hypothetical protein